MLTKNYGTKFLIQHLLNYKLYYLNINAIERLIPMFGGSKVDFKLKENFPTAGAQTFNLDQALQP